MTDLLDEVLRDQSDEKKLYYFRKFLPYVIALTMVIALVMAFNNWRQNNNFEKNTKIGDLLTRIISSDSAADEKLASLESLASQNEGHIIELAKFEQVSIKLDSKDYEGAKDILDRIIKNNNYHILTTAYARLLWLSLAIDQKSIEGEDKAKFEEYIKYFKDQNQPFFASASLLKAVWHMQNNQHELAKDVLKKVIALGPETPLAIRDQASSLLASIQ